MKHPFIKIWAYKDLPIQYDAYIEDKDDIDYVALLPPEYQNVYVGFLENGSFGCCSVKDIDLPKRFTLKVGYHA